MKHPKSISLGLICLFMCSTPAKAWHEAGHMVTALIAYEQLDPAVRGQLLNLLKHHPRFDEDFKADLPAGLTADDEGRFYFCRAAVWPDLVRTKKDGSIPPDRKVKTSYHRSHWHFINMPFALLPVGATAAERKELEESAAQRLNLSTDTPAQEALNLNVVQAIRFNAGVLRNSQSDSNRAVAICWILHTIGDIHQPLHSSALFTRKLFKPSAAAPEGDRGGNRVKFGPGHNDNLHFLWDHWEEPDEGQLSFQAVVSLAEGLLDDAELKAKGEAAAQKTDPAEWAKESSSLTKQKVFTKALRTQLIVADPLDLNPDQDALVHLSSKYRNAVERTTEERIIQGGFRLAVALKVCCP